MLACAVFTLPGCGTLIDTLGDDRRRDAQTFTRVRTGRVRIYGGMRYDLEILAEAGAGWMLALYAIDIPLSLVVDTLLLPFTIPYNLSR
ncbi:MAG: YceK/YidQ family lipoprotein [Planctomycetes bacterium]|nr:YceK/YidQ family lipoprotein [Planctomycetota bacterium]